MTPLPDIEPKNRVSLLDLIRELTAMTERLIDCTMNGRYDAAEELTELRGACVEELERIHLASVGDGSGGFDPVLFPALQELSERSRVLNETIQQQSAGMMAALQAAQQHRFYSNTSNTR